MIYTLTTNPAIDMVVTCDGLHPNRVTRTRDASYSPNGKGLNVSFVLDHYGTPSTIMGFFGGFTGRWIAEEAAKSCPVVSVEADGITRVNTFVNAGDCEYVMPNAGAPVSREHQLEMLDVIRKTEDMDTLVVSGSLSPEMDASYYDELADVCAERGIDLILDVSHAHLKELVERKPLLIKPNDEEIEQIFGVDAGSPEQVIAALHTIHDRGARNILCTLGGAGAYFIDDRHVYHATAAKVKVLSTACAGDSTLAAFLSIWHQDRDAVEPALRRAMATGANVAMSAGIGDLALVDELEKQIQVEVVE